MSSRYLRIIAAVAFAFVVITVGGAYWLTMQLVDPMLVVSEVSAKNTERNVLIEGLVVENNRGCERNGECYLRLELDGKEIITIYDYGKERHCLNEEAAAQGMEIAEGDQVEVYGWITGDSEVSTCEWEGYRIGITQ